MKIPTLLIAILGSLFGYCATAIAADPVLIKIDPGSIIGCRFPRILTLTGSDFESNLEVEVTATGVNHIILASHKVKTTPPNSAEITINTSDDPDTWSVRVRNGNGPFSKAVNFVVMTQPVSPAHGEYGSVIGQHRNVVAKSNGECTGLLKSKGSCIMTSYLCEAYYQCVDYAKKYYKKHYPHITEVDSTWVDANTFWGTIKHPNLDKKEYPLKGVEQKDLPQANDMIFFEHSAGHVAIVKKVSDKIYIIQQNLGRYDADGELIMTHDNTTGLIRIAPNNGMKVLGWLTPKPIKPLVGNQTPSTSSQLMTDDFNDNSVDPTKWASLQGFNVLEQGQILKIETNVTDSGGRILSHWMDIDPTRPLTISRRVKTHYGNDKYRGWMGIELDGFPDYRFGVSYGNMHYLAGIYCSVDGFFVYRSNHHGGQCTDLPDLSNRITPVWDQWFDEKIVYDPQSGVLEYYINNQLQTSFNVGPLPPLSSNRIRLNASAWGWWTGHYHYIDDLVVTQ